ncbi:non-ribosomal peptide synthetase [Anabaena sp. FACHB-709]|uniref:Non-ribosomal peptide synthetase n=2 Tax=Nostocaceae TaxID=1162 RepID=A0ABR7ZAN2_ANACY|nr:MULTISPECIES: non-ribosomal peptide synthetase [Nostocaceae]BAY68269.1 putative non-ribosomal peptide synthetase [Trichormus variabilis NIES-23]HBW33511.1 non-ribosomal peptide synthetase [Nostoc sp. UBA8866]MBD2169655.1 non-ribosomal peptide synthetase [Anabaena cylindrica FACHB-318]MBD2261926.1 non-ribosomal peptide synthetase [Anabaena sp. FACHB-709]MBD2271511.1 non-ribosomal peptide synthetase [Nostoc sp. PCC 7120 = FACHB-418]
MTSSQPNIPQQLQSRLASLTPEKRALLEKLLRQKANSSQTIPPRNNNTELPLSLAQERLWFLHQINPSDSSYNIAISWQLAGKLEISTLLASLQTIIQRHESLRTAFLSQEGKPYQKIAANIDLQLPIIDLQGLPPQQQAQTAQDLAKLEASQPFDLTQAPLMRVKLIRLAPNQATLLLTLHHIIADGWSRGILLRELATCYRAFINDEQPSLPALSNQYADFALWQRECLQREEMAAQLAYWQQKLAKLPTLELPTDYPRTALQKFNGKTESYLLPKTLSESLKQLSKQQGVTLFMLLLAAFKVLLHRYCQQDEIVLGVPSANRDRQQIQSLIGFFVNTLVLRTDLSENPTFTTLLERIRTTAAEAFEYQEIPFAKVVEALQIERDLSHNPLVQVMFQVQNEAYQLQNDSQLDLQIPDLEIQQTWVETGATKFDLTCHIVERSQGLLVVMEYCTDLFQQQTITRMIQHLRVILAAIVENPSRKISEIPILTPQEQHQILVEWNQTQVDYPQKWLHQLFEEQVQRTPDSIAVCYQEQTLTYQELNSKVNQLAHHLQKLGVGCESLVGIYLERSPELIIALLAVLKAGGAYIPLDNKLPPERLAYMLGDAQPRIILTMAASVTGLPDYQGTVICLDEDWQSIAQNPTENLPNIVTGENLAYIIYTSGSTGKPKGVMLTHRGLANYLQWAIQTYPVDLGVGVPVQSAISFDATITSLYTPLLVGKAVILLPEAEEIEALKNALSSARNFSLVKLTPAHLSILSQLLPQKVPAGYPQAFIIGGEALTEQHLEFWRSYFPQTKLINEYGPTETVVGCCIYDASQGKSSKGNVPIGRPIANTRLYILDRYLQPVPIGVPGELYIGGAGVARGYLNRPELTAERFISQQSTVNSQQSTVNTLYKPGDRARYLSDGTIEYLGRLDDQVKIRGFRVELGEIEAILKAHPSVQEAVVILQKVHPQSSQLVAYLVGNQQTVDFRQYLATKLPAYMLPSAFVWLEQLPLTTNGKVDKQQLPAPAAKPESEQVAPRNAIEATLVEIWTEILGVSVGIHDNFFERGGDSILSIQMVAKANNAGIKLTPKQLFQHQTIAELATVIEIAPTTQVEQGIATGIVPLTPIQHWLFEQNLHKWDYFNQAVLLEVAADLEVDYLKQAIEELVLHHDVLRSCFINSSLDGAWEQDIIPTFENGEIFTVVDLNGFSANQQTQQIESVASQLQASLDLAQGILFKVALFKLGDNQNHRLLFIIHHLVVDGISWRILLEDLVTAYQQLKAKQTSIKLSLKTTSFREWAQNLVNYAESDQVVAQFKTWLEILPKQLPQLPLDKIGKGDNNIASEAEIQVKLDISQTRALIEAVPKAYQTQINDVLLTALALTYSQWTQQNSVLIDLETHGREDLFANINITRTVGWFTTIFPVFLELKNINNLEENLKYVKERLREIPQKGISYGLLRYLNPNQQISQTLQSLPQSAISFNYLGQLDLFTSQGWILGLAKESTGLSSHPLNQRRYVLNINAWIAQSQLQIQWRYSRNLHDTTTIENLAQQFIKTLQAIIQHCQAPNSGGYTPSDFAGARLNQQQLDKFLNKLQPKKR